MEMGREASSRIAQLLVCVGSSDDAPHAMPIWGIWVDQRFYFSTGGKSRKAKNLARNRKCVVCTEKAHEAVIVEGIAAPVKDKKLIARVAPYYHKKYKPWKLDPKDGSDL